MSREMWLALIGGGVSALASMAVFAGVPGGILLVYLAPLPLLLVGLGCGASAAATAGLAGFVFSGLMGGISTAGIYAIIDALPAWLITRQLLARQPAGQWNSLGPAVAWLSVLASVMLCIFALTMRSETLGIDETITKYLTDALALMAPTLPENMRSSMVTVLTPLFLGMVGTAWVLMMMINAGLAQAILAHNKGNLRPPPEIGDLALPSWTSWLIVGAATLALPVDGQMEYTLRNMVVVLATPFFFLGMAVVHHAARFVTFPGTLLAFFYFVLMVSGWAPLVVVGIGMIEQWAGLRTRFTGPRNLSGTE
ncbi:MAG: hypothetical protein A3H92_00480 [Rhodospirillales bacterium RIFCSPLOWO2_02_FULL_58_16]|nr:MAG: hypothetical protein A3H92_00480 [Rhodospirillales bacterium RIFCSPLOWO2_02_FULL_58_16]